MTTPTHRTTLIYTEALLRSAVRGFWWRSIGPTYLVAIVLLATGFGIQLAQGRRDWWIGVVGAVLLMAVSFAVALYLVHLRQIRRKFAALGNDRSAVLELDPQGVTLTGTIGSSTFRWNVIVEVWRLPHSWLLLFSKAQFSTLPLDCLPPALQEFLLERVRAAGGRIR